MAVSGSLFFRSTCRRVVLSCLATFRVHAGSTWLVPKPANVQGHGHYSPSFMPIQIQPQVRTEDKT